MFAGCGECSVTGLICFFLINLACGRSPARNENANGQLPHIIRSNSLRRHGIGHVRRFPQEMPPRIEEAQQGDFFFGWRIERFEVVGDI